MADSAQLAAQHWNETPLFLTEEERYSVYPWLYEAGEFRGHAGERVLEVGCGSGCDLLQFAKHGATATGVDIADMHLELARRRVGDRATVVKADMRRLPFPDASFDYVYSHGVLHHCSEPEQAAAEMLRVLRPGGRLNIHVYARYSECALVYRLKYGTDWKLHVENSTRPVYLKLYTAAEVRRLFPRCRMKFAKHTCYRLHFAQSLLGWFLCGVGIKPADSPR